MITLANPLPYESKLEALNDLHLLTFDPTLRVQVQMGALDRQPSTSGGAVRGLFLRGDGSAVMQNRNPHGDFTTMTAFGGVIYANNNYTIVDLAAVCEWVGLEAFSVGIGEGLYLANMADGDVIKLVVDVYMWFQVRTQYITLRHYGPPGSSSSLNIERLIKA